MSAKSPAKRQALGRGLNALIAAKPTPQIAAPGAGEAVRKLSIQDVVPNPNQPRTVFQAEAIEELAQSIRSDGLIQPVLVRPQGNKYLIVAGERRWRAAQLAGLVEIPAIIRDIDDKQVLEIALIENIQREDLNPIEVAVALQRLSQELNLSHEELAQRTGKNRTTITNLLRLLRLPREIQAMVAEGILSMGHARAMLSLEHAEEQIRIAEQITARGLSVRQVEQLVKNLLEPAPPKEAPAVDPNIAAAVEQLEISLGTRVKLIQRGKKGRIEIEYSSQEELDRIYALLTGEQ